VHFRFLLVLALLVPAACDSVPRPFQPERKAALLNPLIRPKADASLKIEPVRGLNGVLSDDLAELVAFDLRERGVPAFTDFVNRSSWWLYGEYRTGPAQVDWTLIDPEGKNATNLTTAAPNAARPPGRAEIEAMARAAVPAIEKLVRIDPGPQVEPTVQTVFLKGVEGAPGDGNEALTRAMRVELERMGVKLAETPAAGALTLSGRVQMADQGSQQRVAIAWTLLDAAGTEVGAIAQENAIPRGRLDARWGHIAWVAAQGGAVGLQDLLKAAAMGKKGG
jgi:hypothetical protein